MYLKFKKQFKKQSVQDLHTWKGAVKEERVPHPGNPLHQLGDQAEQTGNFRGSEESAAAGLQQTGQRETSIDTPGHLPALPSPRHMYAGTCGSQALKVGLQTTDPGRGLGLAMQREPKGTGVWSGHTGSVCRTEPGSTIEALLLTHK